MIWTRAGGSFYIHPAFVPDPDPGGPSCQAFAGRKLRGRVISRFLSTLCHGTASLHCSCRFAAGSGRCGFRAGPVSRLRAWVHRIRDFHAFWPGEGHGPSGAADRSFGARPTGPQANFLATMAPSSLARIPQARFHDGQVGRQIIRMEFAPVAPAAKWPECLEQSIPKESRLVSAGRQVDERLEQANGREFAECRREYARGIGQQLELDDVGVPESGVVWAFGRPGPRSASASYGEQLGRAARQQVLRARPATAGS